jgi:hypothetical protein
MSSDRSSSPGSGRQRANYACLLGLAVRLTNAMENQQGGSRRTANCQACYGPTHWGGGSDCTLVLRLKKKAESLKIPVDRINLCLYV